MPIDGVALVWFEGSGSGGLNALKEHRSFYTTQMTKEFIMQQVLYVLSF